MINIYTAVLAPTAVTVAADLFEITPASNVPILIHGLRVFQTSDFGDAQDEVIGLAIVAGNTTSGSGGNAAAAPAKRGGTIQATASATFESANTTAASAGTARTCYSTGWNVRAPLEIVFTPEQRIRVSAGETLCVLRMLGAPADSLTIGASIDFEEI